MMKKETFDWQFVLIEFCKSLLKERPLKLQNFLVIFKSYVKYAGSAFCGSAALGRISQVAEWQAVYKGRIQRQ